MALRTSSQFHPSAPVGPPLGVLLAAAGAAAAAWALLPFHAQPLRLLGWALGSLIHFLVLPKLTHEPAE